MISRPYYLVAGPCSAETEAQVLETAYALKGLGIDAFRAGVWKPRTRPGSFEGLGEQALPWLNKVQKECGFKIAVEVANASHVQLALQYGIDILWVGARTTVNPFSVQEIAEALRGVQMPVWVKNPVNPELSLWMGAIERLKQAGIQEIGAIHRGFSTFTKGPFRNEPLWSIPIELKRLAPELALLCDPSHIGGNPAYIPSIAQKALDLEMSGLMIETHHQPNQAWSDAEQQITPQDLIKIIDQLIVRKSSTDDSMFEYKMQGFRTEIDQLDANLLDILAQRMKIVEEIGLSKKDWAVTILQINRWDEVFRERILEALKRNISQNFAEQLFQLIHDESIRIQTEIMNQSIEKDK